MGIMGDYMNNLMYAMEHSYSEMKIEIDQILKKKDYTTEDENSIFYAVGTCLHAMLDYAERIRSNDLDKDTRDAFKYANNGLKHGIEVETITKSTGGITFPIQFPLEKLKLFHLFQRNSKKNLKYLSSFLSSLNKILDSCINLKKVVEY